MKYKNEIQILNIIKYIPPLFILVLSAITITVIYFENQRNFSLEKQEIEKEFIKHNKQIIKEQVNAVVNYINKEKVSTEEKLKQSIKERIYEAYNIARHVYEENQHLGEENIKKRIKDALRSVRFNEGRGYLFINTMDGYNVMHGLTRKLEGKYLWNFRTSDGNYVVQEIVKKLRFTNETFHDWYWQKTKENKIEYKKIGFIKKFEPFNWFIGTAEYVDDFTKMQQREILERVNNFKSEKSGYIFVFHEDGTYLAHARKSSVGKNIYNSKGIIDQEGKVVVKQTFEEFVSLSKKGGGYSQYIQASNPLTKKPASKIAYITGIEDWNWVVGKGFYEDEVSVILNKKKEQANQEFQNYLQKILLVSSTALILLFLISIFFSKIIESKFKAYKEEIENYLEENNKQQNILSQQSKMAAMGEMIGNIAHQWRQPLSVISTAATGLKLQQELKQLDEKELLETLDSINESVQHLSVTIDDFRDFFKPNKQKTLFSIDVVINRSLQLVSSQFSSSEIKIIKEIESLKFLGYERELLQVLVNIFNNAKDALENLQQNKYLFIDSYIDNEHLMIEIKDNAGGIQENILDKIFEPYFTTKHQSQGTGIGLYMSKEIIEKHMKGKLLVENRVFDYENKEYKGAVFIICLPLQEKDIL